MKKAIYALLFMCFVSSFSNVFAQKQKHQMEKLGRGVVAIRTGSSVYVGWRMLGSDPTDIAFNLYRSTDGAEAIKLNASPITISTNYVDATATLTQANAYFVKPIIGAVEQAASASFTLKANTADVPYLDIPLKAIPNDAANGYACGDASVGDLDGDGEYEIVLKRERVVADNSQGGVTDPTYLEAYRLDGTFMWRVNLGVNIRSGAHYTQFMVYDFDGDGKSEISVKTAEGTTFGDGATIGDVNGDGKVSYVTDWGNILEGPEFLSVIEGATGKELARADYIARGNVTDWGDGYANRSERYLSGVGYFDGIHPSILICRGYYAKSVLEAWDYRDGKLSKRWNFNTESKTAYNEYRDQGDHNLRVGDVDGDGKDEVVYGAMCIDHNGLPLYNTRFGHGDAIHMSDFDPDHAGLEVFNCHEGAGGTITPTSANPTITTIPGWEFRDSTGHAIWSVPFSGDTGRGLMLDIDPTRRGAEGWGPASALYDCRGNVIPLACPVAVGGARTCNFGVWWDGDVLREVFDRAVVNKWDWNTGNSGRQITMYNYGAGAINGTKYNPCVSADILGDWREEVVLNATTSIKIFISTIVATNRFYTFMHDPMYRQSVAAENVGYNQPPETGFWFGANDATTAGINTCTIPAAKLYYPQDLPLLEGTYKIINRSNLLAIDNNGSLTAMSVVSQNTASTNSTQQWNFTYINGYYYITNVASGLALQANGTDVVQNSETTDNTKWTIIPITDSYFQLKNLATGKCIDVLGGTTALKLGDSNSSNDQQFSFKRTQTITMVSNVALLGDTDFSPAVASSRLSITYNSSNLSVATIIDGKVHIVGIGTTIITASQAGDATFEAAPTISSILTVSKKPQLLSINDIAAIPVGNDTYVSGVASSGLSIAYTSSNTAIATVVGNKIHAVAAGTCTITATQAGNSMYAVAPSVDKTLTVTPIRPGIYKVANRTTGFYMDGLAKTQSLSTLYQTTLSTSATSQKWNFAYADGYYTITSVTTGLYLDSNGATANGSPVLQTTLSTNTATINNQKWTIIPMGGVFYKFVNLTTGKAIDSYGTGVNTQINFYDSNTNNNQQWSFTTMPFISMSDFAPATIGDEDVAIDAVASTGFAMTFTSSDNNVAVVVDGKIIIVGEGTCTITASPTDATVVDAAPSVSKPFTVSRKTQTIIFPDFGIRHVGDADISPDAYANSGLELIYSSSDETVATIVNGKIHIVGEGICTITATQGGDATYAPNFADQTLAVEKMITSIHNETTTNNIVIYPNPCLKNTSISYRLGAKSEVEIGVFDVLGNKIKTVLDNTQQYRGDYSRGIPMDELSAGIYLVKIRIDKQIKTLKVTLRK